MATDTQAASTLAPLNTASSIPVPRVSRRPSGHGWRAALSLAWLACGAAAGCHDEAKSIALTDPELAPSAQGFVREAPGCPPEGAPDLTVLPLPWDRRIETYVPPGAAIPTFALDYEVAPLARVERVEVQYDFDARVEITSREQVSHCPLTLPTSAWLPTDVTENIVRARINATDEDGHGRSGDLFVSVGTRTLEVTLGGLDLTSNDPLERWYVLFEPAWGSHRIALMQVPDTAASSFSITGLPTGPGRIALIQTASIAEQDGAATLHAPEGFAGDFAAYTRGWYQAMLLHDDAAPSFVAISPANSSPRFASLGDDVSWTPADGHLVVSCPSATATGVVTFPCGTDATLIVTGYGNVEVAAQGGTPVMLTPGATATPTTTCSNGATEVTWNITTSSLNGRGFDLVLRQEAP